MGPWQWKVGYIRKFCSFQVSCTKMFFKEAVKINHLLGNKASVSQRGHPCFDSEHNCASD